MPQFLINILLMAAFLVLGTLAFRGYASDDNMSACQNGIIMTTTIDEYGYRITTPEIINSEVLTCE